ncbi:hypothetical protein CHARACLAT_030095 [Characodon lateralis]|uniref:Uncharacterized protein n=1 Tax=Characodon lateralis TaxID=208331 RepID=A0ABU7D1U7_9TELE|nr:hypothetical protein [Characodon lateralis]
MSGEDEKILESEREKEDSAETAFPHPQQSTPVPPHSPLSLTSDQVRKAAGPDSINPWLLKTCADQPCEVLSHMYNLSPSLAPVPVQGGARQ